MNHMITKSKLARTLSIQGIPEDIPVILCEVTKDKQWRFWCPYCRRYHHHGDSPGHRAAHCNSGPFRESGYWLVT
jgi:hypothetical protein